MKEQHLSASRCLRAVLLLTWVGLLSACATLVSDMDPPKVTLENFKTLPSEGGAPRFEIALKILNPNKQALNIAGISYTIEIMDREVMAGVTNEVPPIEAYGEGVVNLEAGLQLFEVLRLVSGLGGISTDKLEYRFAAKIDFEGFIPTQRVEEIGELSL